MALTIKLNDNANEELKKIAHECEKRFQCTETILTDNKSLIKIMSDFYIDTNIFTEIINSTTTEIEQINNISIDDDKSHGKYWCMNLGKYYFGENTDNSVWPLGAHMNIEYLKFSDIDYKHIIIDQKYTKISLGKYVRIQLPSLDDSKECISPHDERELLHNTEDPNCRLFNDIFMRPTMLKYFIETLKKATYTSKTSPPNFFDKIDASFNYYDDNKKNQIKKTGSYVPELYQILYCNDKFNSGKQREEYNDQKIIEISHVIEDMFPNNDEAQINFADNLRNLFMKLKPGKMYSICVSAMKCKSLVVLSSEIIQQILPELEFISEKLQIIIDMARRIQMERETITFCQIFCDFIEYCRRAFRQKKVICK